MLQVNDDYNKKLMMLFYIFNSGDCGTLQCGEKCGQSLATLVEFT